ncbi:hypothetical protein [Oceanobacillus oncorhynchi]|uniref:hypothetical protein n=1 Tax=Oceanobacillus oncorhynchi TaxID=545501 RepID=UPI002115EF83|nr:hypothetical protein [Oceanobacillus oncorhynchi]UUI41629.1 hypothetical protein NP440_08895 [Oceanobacillus oncorhynchi]
MRLIWAGLFQENITPDIQEGKLDLSSWEVEEGQSMLLDGEWEFYPSHIDLVIQAANFIDSRDGGIYLSLRFGTDETITREVQLTNYSQVVIAAILFMHTVYTLIIYFIGGRDRKVLSFSLLAFSLFPYGVFNHFLCIGSMYRSSKAALLE